MRVRFNVMTTVDDHVLRKMRLYVGLHNYEYIFGMVAEQPTVNCQLSKTLQRCVVEYTRVFNI